MEETQYDEVVTCDHSYNTRCHTSYVTSFVSTQQEECDENFRSLVGPRPELSFYNFSRQESLLYRVRAPGLQRDCGGKK